MTEARGPLVSVVTPVYNGEKFLGECIESVLAQTYENWDYTIVNNCSTDGTLRIAQSYSKKDPRIRVRTNDEFVRVIPNHNIALRQISPESKYCKPVAGDDKLLPECLERMVHLAEEHPTVGMVGSYGIYSKPEMGVYCKGVPYGTPVLRGPELCRQYLLGRAPAVFGAPSFTLLRSDVVRRRAAFYNESNLHADSEAYLDVLADHDFGFVPEILTFKRVQEGSLSSLSERLNTRLPFLLYALNRYGPTYLTPEELKRRIRECLYEYYGYLGRQVTRLRDGAFWKFHRDRLREVGHPLNTIRLAASTLSYILDLVLNPKRTAEQAWSRLRVGMARS